MVVLGINYDTPESHAKFIADHHLPFVLLSDTDKSVSTLYGTKGFMFPSRKTFLINRNGVVFKIYDKVDVTTHGADLVKDFKNQFILH